MANSTSNAAGVEGPTASTRAQGRAKRLAEVVEPYETLLKFLLLLGGVIYGALFLVRTWALPVASLTLAATQRIPQLSGDLLIVQATFEMGEAANVRIKDLRTTCNVLDGGQSCAAANCRFASDSLVGGILPRKEIVSWGCHYSVPSRACVHILQRVGGKAIGLAAKSSHWWSTIIHCGVEEK